MCWSSRRVLVKPSSTPALTKLHTKLAVAREKMHAAAAAARKVQFYLGPNQPVYLKLNSNHKRLDIPENETLR